MAEAFFNSLAKGEALAASAGTKPGAEVNPKVVQAMLEVGIDISQRKPKALTLEMVEGADRDVTMGCNADEVCPASFVPTEDWALEEPHDQPIEKVREIRDEIRTRVEVLLKEFG
jgi:arsenate reductase